MDMATSQTFLQSFSQSDSQAEDQRNTPVFNKKSYQQAKKMAENKHNRPKNAHPNQHSDYKQQKQFFRKEGPSNVKRPAFKPQGEVHPCSPDFAPMNIFENQVIPIGIHNLSKSFRPNLATVRVLSLGNEQQNE